MYEVASFYSDLFGIEGDFIVALDQFGRRFPLFQQRQNLVRGGSG